jgi:hypothetical protein
MKVCVDYTGSCAGKLQTATGIMKTSVLCSNIQFLRSLGSTHAILNMAIITVLYILSPFLEISINFIKDSNDP